MASSISVISFESTRVFLRKSFEVSYVSDLHSPILFDELAGKSDFSLKDRRLSLALVRAAIRKTLGFGHLIDSVEMVWSDDPEPIFSTVLNLDKTTHCGKGCAMNAVESYKANTFDGQADFTPHNGIERCLDSWILFSLAILEREFTYRGWI